MTGLYNKDTTELLVRRALARADGTPCALLIADLDDLKSINDTLGHPCGDQVIRQIAVALKAQFRHTDIVGRIGGDEFLAFLDGVGDRARLEGIMHKLFTQLTALEAEHSTVGPLDVSVGITTARMDGVAFEKLYTQADKALYMAKRNGKRQYAFYTPKQE